MTAKFLAAAILDGRPVTPPPRLAQALRRIGCVDRWSAPGLELYASGDLPVRRLSNGHGIVVGHVFDRSGTQAPATIAASLCAPAAETVVRRLWGSYVAFSRDADCIRVLRDPSGGLACYRSEIDGVQYFTSVPHVLVDCGLVAADVDWSLVAMALVRRRARSSATALRRIDELLPGTLLTCRRGAAVSRQVWDPGAIPELRRSAEAADRLEQVLASTLRAWARVSNHPLVEVSGGLDSAIVAAGIAAGANRASLITFSAAPGDPDETAYARAVADHLGLPLEIGAPSIGDVDLTRSSSRDLPRPTARAFTQATDALSLGHARSIGADAFLSGGGGDDVFCYLRTIVPALDRLNAQGVRAMMQTALDIAVMNHSTLWDSLLRIARRLRHGPSRDPRMDLRFLARGLAEGPDLPAPPNPSGRRRPGREDHLRGILTIHNELEGHARTGFAPIVWPLLSQPVIECCLSIPTWIWCEQGRNRAVARRAFEARLPRMVVERRSKGAFDGFCAQLLERNRALVREMLTEGRLAGEGLIDRRAVQAALGAPSPPADTVARLLALADVESWTQSWCSRQPAVR